MKQRSASVQYRGPDRSDSATQRTCHSLGSDKVNQSPLLDVMLCAHIVLKEPAVLLATTITFQRLYASPRSFHTFFLSTANMGRKAFCVPALVTSFIAWVLLLLCTISTPTTFHTSTPFNFVQASHLGNISDLSNGANPDRNLTAIKVGTAPRMRGASVRLQS